MRLAIPHLRAAEKGEKAPVEKSKNTHHSSPFLFMTSSEPIKFDEQGRLDGQYAQDTSHDFLKPSPARLDVGGGGSMGSGDVKAESEPPPMYTLPSVPSYPQQKPTVATSTSPVIERIREVFYAALADVFVSTPSLIPLLKSNPPRAYFDAVALAVFVVSTSPSFLAASSSDNDVVRDVRGNPITLSDCPPYLRPVVDQFIAIGCDAANIKEEDDMEADRLVQEGRKGEEDVPRFKRARLLLEQGAGYDVGSADGRVVAFVDQVNTLASDITQLPQFKKRQDKVFGVLGGVGLSS